MQKHFVIAEDDEEDIELYKQAVVETNLPIKLTTVLYCEGIFKTLNVEPLPDLIIVDGHLPDLSLLDCVTSIKMHQSLAKNPLVVLTGSNLASIEGKSYLAGINLFLEKPLEFNSLVDIFKRLYYMDWFSNPVLTSERFFAMDL